MKKKVIHGGVVSLLVCIILCIVISWLDIGAYISIIGSVASLYGIWVAYLQIKSVRTVAQETQRAVNEKLTDLNRHLSVVDMSHIISMGRETLAYLHSCKLEIALFRIRDFKAEIVYLQQNESLLAEEKKVRLNTCVSDLGVDIANLRANYKKKDQISIETINSHIEEALTIVEELEGKYKYKEYDTGKI